MPILTVPFEKMATDIVGPFPRSKFGYKLHGTLVPMIRKAISDKLAWPEQVKYALFALRDMPARYTRYSPYEIVFGRQFPSPLALLFDTWSEKQSKPVKLNVWLDKFDKRVESIRDSVREKLEEVKKKNSELERKKLLRVFERVTRCY